MGYMKVWWTVYYYCISPQLRHILRDIFHRERYHLVVALGYHESWLASSCKIYLSGPKGHPERYCWPKGPVKDWKPPIQPTFKVMRPAVTYILWSYWLQLTPTRPMVYDLADPWSGLRLLSAPWLTWLGRLKFLMGAYGPDLRVTTILTRVMYP